MESSFTSHHHAKSRCFFKIIFSEIGSNSKLMIPVKFVRKYGHELQRAKRGVLLKAPGAPPWPVDVQRENGKVWLRNGWPEFAKFYSVCFGHFIFFKYQGNCNFKVVIFDTNTTEIDYPLRHGESSGSDQLKVFKKNQEKIAEALSETSDSDEEEHGDIEKPSHPNGNQHDTDRMNKRVKLEVDLDIPMQQHVVQARGVSSPATIKEKHRVLANAKAFKSIHPSFEVVMQPSYVGKTYCLSVNKACLRSYIRSGVDVLILRIARKSWLVKCSVRSRRLKLGCGWQQFAEDNALAVGDVCVFELVKPERKLIDVVIHRAAAVKEEIDN